MDNIEEILRALTEDSDEHTESANSKENNESNAGSIFDGLDPEFLLSLLGLFEKMNTSDDSERLLLALKPMLRDENKAKIDTAIKFLKLFSLLPLLKESGMLGKLF